MPSKAHQVRKQRLLRERLENEAKLKNEQATSSKKKAPQQLSSIKQEQNVQSPTASPGPPVVQPSEVESITKPLSLPERTKASSNFLPSETSAIRSVQGPLNVGKSAYDATNNGTGAKGTSEEPQASHGDGGHGKNPWDGKQPGAGDGKNQEHDTKPAVVRVAPPLPAPPLRTVSRRTEAATIQSNYFRIQQTYPHDSIHTYKVKFHGNKDEQLAPGRIRRRAVYCLITQHYDEAQSGINIATDFSQWFVTRRRLPSLDMPLEVLYYDEDSTIARSRRSYFVDVAHHKTLSWNDFIQICQGNTTMAEDTFNLNTLALNLMFSRRPAKYSIRNPSEEPTIACLGAHRSFSLSQSSPSLGGGLDAHSGMKRGVLASLEPLLSINTTTGAFYREGPLSDLITASDHYHGQRWDHLGAFIKGCRVRTNHLKKKHGDPNYLEKIYSIKGLARPEAPNHRARPDASLIEFHWSKHPGGAQDISVYDYYRREYPSAQVGRDSLVVNCGTDKRPTYFPVPVLHVLAGQPFRGALNSDQVQTLVPLASANPYQKLNSIIATAKGLLGMTDSIHGPEVALGIAVAPGMVTPQAKLFDPPVVYYGRANADFKGSVKQGGWKLNKQKLTKCTASATGGNRSFAILQVIQDHRQILNSDNWAGARSALEGAFREMGLSKWKYYESGDEQHHLAYLTRSAPFPSPDDENADVGEIKAKLNILKRNAELVFVLLPSRSLQVYSSVKRAGDNLASVHTICSALKRAGPNYYLNSNGSYLWNIMLKVNLKFNGTNQWLGSDWAKSGILSQPTMFVGIDVTHPGPGSQQDAPSIAAVVATTDHTQYAQWRTSLRCQIGEKQAMEVVVDLKEMLIERLKAWRANPANSGRLPKHVVIYRDGGSEGLFKRIMEDEWPQISAALANADTYGLDPANQPRVALICAIKRNSTRFFATPDTLSSCLGTHDNLRAGLFVNNTVTLNIAKYPDFFLQSHDSLIGTARPCHYAMLKNELGVSTEQLALLTHDMCHLFGRATTTVSCHPAVYYADMACERARVHMRRAFEPYRPDMTYDDSEWTDFKMAHANLRDSMYFV